MNAQELLQEIADYCRHSGLAESTFGRRAVNDGKLASRLRNGGRITTETLERIRGFMAQHSSASPARRRVLHSAHDPRKRVAQDRRAPRADVVDVALAVGVPDVRPSPPGKKARGPAHRAKGANRRVDAGWDGALRAGEEFVVSA